EPVGFDPPIERIELRMHPDVCGVNVVFAVSDEGLPECTPVEGQVDRGREIVPVEELPEVTLGEGERRGRDCGPGEGVVPSSGVLQAQYHRLEVVVCPPGGYAVEAEGPGGQRVGRERSVLQKLTVVGEREKGFTERIGEKAVLSEPPAREIRLL